MIGSALKKLAKENAMTVSSGVAYGSFRGYAVTFSEGMGYKRMDIVTRIPDAEQQRQLEETLRGVDLTKEYRVQELTLGAKSIGVVFVDNPGTMKKMNAFIEWFFPLLMTHGAQAGSVCPECGTEASGSWYLVNGVAYPMHDSCANHLQETINTEEQQRQEADTGSYGTGTVGAFLGAFLGSIVWAVVLYLGYVAAYIGLLIGWLAEKGYTLFHGKRGKAKLWILILAIVFGVLVGTLLPDAVVLGSMISSGELPGYSYGDIPAMILLVFQEDAQYARGVLANGGLGLLFAALGVFGLLAKTKKETDVPKLKKLS